MKAVFAKRMEGIFPTDEAGRFMIQSMPQGAMCMVEYIKKRNYENHKRYMAFIDICFNMQDHFDNPEIFRKHIQMAAGHFEEVVVIHPKTGEAQVQYWPKSIAFEKMGEEEFKELFSRSIDAFLQRYGNGMDEQELMRIVGFA